MDDTFHLTVFGVLPERVEVDSAKQFGDSAVGGAPAVGSAARAVAGRARSSSGITAGYDGAAADVGGVGATLPETPVGRDAFGDVWMPAYSGHCNVDRRRLLERIGVANACFFKSQLSTSILYLFRV